MMRAINLLCVFVLLNIVTAITLESPDITTILTHRIKETGEAIELYCKILVNSHEMSIPLRDVLQPTTNLTNTKYLIKPYSADDEGVFACSIISNEFYPLDELMIYNEDEEDSSQISLLVNEGDWLTLECYSDGYNETWHFGENSSGTNSLSWGQILNISSIREKDGGIYSCIASKNTTTSGRNVEIVINEKYYKPKTPLNPIVRALGEEAVLQCSLEINRRWPIPTISIYKTSPISGLYIIPHPHNQTTIVAELKIEHVEQKHEGNYTCKAEYESGESTEAIIRLIVEKKPTITVNRTQIVQLLNKDGELHCQVEAYPPADVTWYKDSTKLKKEEHYRMEAATDENGHTDATLQILTMERGDEGTYICHAQNKHGSINSTIELIVEYRPIITIDQPHVMQTLGSDAHLGCRIEAYPPADVNWYKNSIQLTNNQEFEISAVKDANGNTNAILRIFTVDLKDNDNYTCRAQNKLGSTDSTVELIVQHSPMITIVEPRVSRTAGDDANLECRVQAIPSAHVTWYRNSIPLEPNEHHMMSEVKDVHEINNAMLRIFTVDLKDNGNYTCRAQNELGSTNSTVELIVQDIPIITILQPRVSQKLGRDVNLTCSVEANPEANVIWYKDSIQLNADKNRDMIETKDDNGNKMATILISDVKMKDNGSYICVAENKLGSNNSTVELIVEYSPIITVVQSRVSRKLDRTAALNCLVDANPPADVTWYKDSIQLKTDENFDMIEAKGTNGNKEATILISAVTLKDNGSYTCVAQNKLGSNNSTVELIVEYRPIITINQSYAMQTLGSDAHLGCRIKAYPRADVTWYKNSIQLKNNQELEISAAKDANGNTNAILRIFTVDLKDNGNYTCHAQNKLGSTNSTVQLIVQHRPIITIFEPRVSPTLGRDFNLTCSVEANPEANVIWYKDSIQLKADKNGDILETKDDNGNKMSTILISAVKLKDKGSYTCVSENILGSNKSTVELNVEHMPVITMAQHLVNQTLGGKVDLVCRVEANPPANVTWYKNSVPAIRNGYGNTSYVKDVNGNANSTLRILSVEPKDKGNYTCVAENELGSMNSTVELIVKHRPTITADPHVVGQALGHEADLKCIVQAYPPAAVIWFKNSSQLKSVGNSSETADEYIDTLHITSVKTEDFGNYTCKATNVEGSSEATIELIEISISPLRSSGTITISSKVFIVSIVLILMIFKWKQ